MFDFFFPLSVCKMKKKQHSLLFIFDFKMNKFYNNLYISKIYNLLKSIINSNQMHYTHLKSEFLYLLKRIILKYSHYIIIKTVSSKYLC